MAVQNREISTVFSQVADLLEIDGANPFRVRAYRKAARVVSDLAEELADPVAGDVDLTEIDGIGKDLAGKIETIVKTGTLPDLGELHQRIPVSVHDLLALPGLGPKRVKGMIEELGITTLEGVEAAARDGRLAALPGLGAKSVEKLLKSVQQRRDAGKRFLRAQVDSIVTELIATLQAVDPAADLTAAGSFRRSRESVGDIDVLAVSTSPAALMQALAGDPAVEEVLAQGGTKTSVVLKNGLQVDLRVVPAESRGAALHYFTGSKAHNIVLRRRAQQRDMKLNEYGLFRGEEQVAGATEEDLFAALDLGWIPPELREDRGEVDAAEQGLLPDLITRPALRGDLHSHTTASDGRGTLAQMVEAAQAAGLTYLAVTDHTKNLAIANGLDEERLLRQIDEIDAFNETLEGFTVLKGSEVDILEDGSLDLDASVLSRLDLVVGAVHTLFHLPREKQTERILRAMDHATFTILAHGTGRKVLQREPYEADVPRILEKAKERGCYVELNGNPRRLDLNEVYCRMARDLGVLVSIDSDAHRTQDFANLAHGVGQARRAWLTAADVLNTRPLDELRPLLRATMG